MIGLTDRVQPWARRFQRAPAPPDRPKTEKDPVPPPAERRRATPRRFVRGVLHEQKR